MTGKTIAAILFLGLCSPVVCQAESFIFINNTNVDVDYVLLHHNPQIRVTGGAKPGSQRSHNNLNGFGERAIIVWRKDGSLLYAGSGAMMQKGYNLFLTLEPLGPNSQPNGFGYHVTPALGN